MALKGALLLLSSGLAFRQVPCSWGSPVWNLSEGGKQLEPHVGVASTEEGLAVGISFIPQLASHWAACHSPACARLRIQAPWLGGNLCWSTGIPICPEAGFQILPVPLKMCFLPSVGKIDTRRFSIKSHPFGLQGVGRDRKGSCHLKLDLLGPISVVWAGAMRDVASRHLVVNGRTASCNVPGRVGVPWSRLSKDGGPKSWLCHRTTQGEFEKYMCSCPTPHLLHPETPNTENFAS